jgi:RNA polymerase sigma factor (sigma-70 family)
VVESTGADTIRFDITTLLDGAHETEEFLIKRERVLVVMRRKLRPVRVPCRIHFGRQTALNENQGVSAHEIGHLPKDLRQSFVSSIAIRYGERLRSFLLRRLRNEADVPDLAQEVFLRLVRVKHAETIRSPEAYLFTVASHVLHQHALKQLSTPPSVDISELFSDLELTSSDDPALKADVAQRVEHLERLLKELPPKISTTLVLHRLGGFSIEEIGQRLGIARVTAKKYLARALTHLRDAHEATADKEGP